MEQEEGFFFSSLEKGRLERARVTRRRLHSIAVAVVAEENIKGTYYCKREGRGRGESRGGGLLAYI